MRCKCGEHMAFSETQFKGALLGPGRERDIYRCRYCGERSVGEWRVSK